MSIVIEAALRQSVETAVTNLERAEVAQIDATNTSKIRNFD